MSILSNLLINYNQRKKLFIVFILLFIFFYLFAAYMTYSFSKENLYKSIDRSLETKASTINYFLQENFHERALGKDSISKEEDLQNIKNLSKLVKHSDIEYVYTMVKKGEDIYFTSSSATEDDFQEDQVTYYFDKYESATAVLKNAFESKKSLFEESTDQWGTFRTIFIPMETRNGEKYILGADIKIDFIEKKLQNILQFSGLIFCFFLISFFILYRLMKKIDKRELEFIDTVESNLKEEIEKKTHQFEELNDSLEMKIKEKTRQLEELNRSLEDKVQIEVDKNLKNEIKLLEQSKMASMGEMIGNIAHQWRQPLSVISTGATGLQVHKEYGTLTDELLMKSCDSINGSAQYLSETIDTFRNFLKEDKVYKEVIIQDRVDIAINLLESILDHLKIKLINRIDYSTPIKIKLVVGEITQVLVNLMNNAKDVLIEKRVEEPWIKLDLQVTKSDATIIVEDNGGGIDEENINRIFEPYFTTKHQSVGTGLGLYMSHKIITQSLKGDLSVKNSEFGAKFYIKLPLKIEE